MGSKDNPAMSDILIPLRPNVDPAELAKLRVQGVTADRDQARRWYDRARQLGSSAAQSRLDALDRR